LVLLINGLALGVNTMNMRSIIVRATWDDEAEVWVATSNDIEGLAVESESMEKLQPKVMAAVADLLELNGIGIQSKSF
jgi:Domain of unknown function (DUF1902)